MATVLAEDQVLAVWRICDAVIAPTRIPSECCIDLENNAGVGVEHLDGLLRTQSEDGAGVVVGVQRDGLRSYIVAEVNLGAGWSDDLAGADNPRAVRPARWIWAGNVGRIRVGLSNGERR